MFGPAQLCDTATWYFVCFIWTNMVSLTRQIQIPLFFCVCVCRCSLNNFLAVFGFACTTTWNKEMLEHPPASLAQENTHTAQKNAYGNVSRSRNNDKPKMKPKHPFPYRRMKPGAAGKHVKSRTSDRAELPWIMQKSPGISTRNKISVAWIPAIFCATSAIHAILFSYPTEWQNTYNWIHLFQRVLRI